jgi:hypothetical protein
MTYANLTTKFSWKAYKGPAADSKVHVRVDERPTRRVVLMRDLDAEWLRALETADYSHLDSESVKQPD